MCVLALVVCGELTGLTLSRRASGCSIDLSFLLAILSPLYPSCHHAYNCINPHFLGCPGLAANEVRYVTLIIRCLAIFVAHQLS